MSWFKSLSLLTSPYTKVAVTLEWSASPIGPTVRPDVVTVFFTDGDWLRWNLLRTSPCSRRSCSRARSTNKSSMRSFLRVSWKVTKAPKRLRITFNKSRSTSHWWYQKWIHLLFWRILIGSSRKPVWDYNKRKNVWSNFCCNYKSVIYGSVKFHGICHRPSFQNNNLILFRQNWEMIEIPFIIEILIWRLGIKFFS